MSDTDLRDIIIIAREAADIKEAMEHARRRVAATAEENHNHHIVYDRSFWQLHGESERFEIYYDNVICVEADSAYSILHLDGLPMNKLSRTTNLAHFKLGCSDERFFHLHRSWLINLHHMRRIDRWVRTITLTRGITLHVPRARQKQLLEALHKHLGYTHSGE